MKGFPKDRKIKWSGFRYKQNNDISQLCGVGLDFSDGTQTPMFETETAQFQRQAEKRILINTNRTIRKIAMKAFLKDSFLGLRLTDDEGRYIVDETWSKWSHSEWTEFEVPKGMEVIGLVTRHSNYEMIQRIGFMLWKPPVTAINDFVRQE